MTSDYLLTELRSLAQQLRLKAEQGDRESLAALIAQAEQGHMYARFELGLLYFHGRGVTQDYAAAEKWYHMAEKQGSKEAKLARENLEYVIKSAIKDKEKKPSRTDEKDDSELYGIVSIVVGVTVFLGSWIYCIARYGFLFGVGLGWLPSGIVAVLAALLWPIVVIVLCVGVVVTMLYVIAHK